MTTETRIDLLTLRATLRNFGLAHGSADLARYDAHARWILARLGEPTPANDTARITPLGCYAKARELTLAISLRVQRTVAGCSQSERDEVFCGCHQFEDVVRDLLYATTRRRGAAPRTATTARPTALARGNR